MRSATVVGVLRYLDLEVVGLVTSLGRLVVSTLDSFSLIDTMPSLKYGYRMEVPYSARVRFVESDNVVIDNFWGVSTTGDILKFHICIWNYETLSQKKKLTT